MSASSPTPAHAARSFQTPAAPAAPAAHAARSFQTPAAPAVPAAPAAHAREPYEKMDVAWPEYNLSVVVSVTAGGERGEPPSIAEVCFILKTTALSATISLGATERFAASVWNDLAAGAVAAMSFTRTNGEVSLASDGTTVSFSLARYGGSDDSDVTIEVPLACLARSFGYVARRVAEIRAGTAR